ncbi:STM4011 family radical SAM protein [Deinococcus sp. KNUC1210]|uniref:STM4011 family radical SAM protein n=1 Tax=Deinococcus sp. KNUC1210 TaxID=2917691 RepID=UPI001EF05D6E|nr:STM4011 family radical SAM protein [Deinococcus sp. KNUC1210]ULH16180.1 STM4011 family radical SAM protein [Deinococcus sp. KNUC1210]
MSGTERPRLTVHYRGPLGSCNYGCPYCPFAKRKATRREVLEDSAALTRFVRWAETAPFTLSVLFTPWGEALAYPRYQAAIVRLSHLPHVQKVAIQTNLSGALGWLDAAELSKVGIWATYHPTQTTRPRFLKRCAELRARTVSFSVGVVGAREHFTEITEMRAALPDSVYLWVNAFFGRRSYYTPAEREWLSSIDPHFALDTVRHRSRGQACAGGHTLISVDGDGTARPCHFIGDVIGNIYDTDFAARLSPRPCTRHVCDCFIGYAHLETLNLHGTFGEGLLERNPRLNSV